MRTHGTVSNYRKGGCRCGDCRDAYRDACARYRYNRTGGRTTTQPDNPGNWADHAACKGHVDLFVCDTDYRNPGPRTAVKTSHARAICATCPVLTQCRAWALTEPDPAYHMLAGGLDPHERRLMRKRTA